MSQIRPPVQVLSPEQRERKYPRKVTSWSEFDDTVAWLDRSPHGVDRRVIDSLKFLAEEMRR